MIILAIIGFICFVIFAAVAVVVGIPFIAAVFVFGDIFIAIAVIVLLFKLIFRIRHNKKGSK